MSLRLMVAAAATNPADLSSGAAHERDPGSDSRASAAPSPIGAATSSRRRMTTVWTWREWSRRGVGNAGSCGMEVIVDQTIS